MIPIYPAFLLEEKDLPGGTTRPLLISVNTNNGFELYVVKVFSKKQNEQYAPLAKEVYCHFLAKDFDINTPDIALISFHNSFIDTLPAETKSRATEQDVQLYFGSKYHSGFVQYIPAKHHRTFKSWDIEIIFAFDLLVRNIDRRNGKPNLLVKKTDYLAIDHELCLHIYRTFNEYMLNNDWGFLGRTGTNNDRIHIFKQRLHRIAKEIDFTVLHEYLKGMNTQKVLDCANFLHNLGLPIGDIPAINLYLRDVKKDSQKFIQLCKFLIT
jgi:hypothetical protein